MARMTPAQAKKLVQKSNQKTKAVLSQMGSIGEETLARHLQAHKIKYQREFKFNPDSDHRADFFLPEYNLLVEVEGGTRAKSRHTTHDGYSKDLMKYNTAQILGYFRLAFTTEQVSNGAAIQNIKRFITAHQIKRNAVKKALAGTVTSDSIKTMIDNAVSVAMNNLVSMDMSSDFGETPDVIVKAERKA